MGNLHRNDHTIEVEDSVDDEIDVDGEIEAVVAEGVADEESREASPLAGRNNSNSKAKSLLKGQSKGPDGILSASQDIGGDKSEESWGSLHDQYEQMIGLNEKGKSDDGNTSISTVGAAAAKKIEEEIAEEIQKLHGSSNAKANTSNLSIEQAEEIIEEDNYSDDEFNFGLSEVQEMAKAQELKEAEQTKQLLDDDAIVDEVEEEDDLKMLDEELLATDVAKNDARRLKDLISKIDSTTGKDEIEDETAVGHAGLLGSSYMKKNLDGIGGKPV